MLPHAHASHHFLIGQNTKCHMLQEMLFHGGSILVIVAFVFFLHSP